MIDIAALKLLCCDKNIAVTKHAKNRLVERKISILDIISVIKHGEIIKQYEDDRPLPSCLILGSDINGKKCHVVVSHDDDYIYLITAYYPDEKIWSKDLKTRKENALI